MILIHSKLLQTATSFQFSETLKTHAATARQETSALLTAHIERAGAEHAQSTVGGAAIAHTLTRHVTAAKAHTTATPDTLQGAPLELLRL